MTPYQYELAFFAATVWRVSYSSDTNETLAVACAIRNHVIPRMGKASSYRSFTDACEAFLKAYPLRDFPKLSDPAFVSSSDGVLSFIDKVYDCSTPDFTSTMTNPDGAKYFARVVSLPADDWRKREVVDRPDIHPLLGTFGAMQFFE